MASDSTNNILLPNGETIAIPAWASEITLQALVGQMQISNELDKKLIESIKGNTVDTTSIAGSVRDSFKKLKERREADAKAEDKRTGAVVKALAKRTSDIIGAFSNTETPLTNMVNALKGVAEGFGGSLRAMKDNSNGIGRLATAISDWRPGIDALGDAAFTYLGFVAGQTEQFAKAQEQMINAGAIFAQGSASYEDLYTVARTGGITYTQLAKIAGEYGQTLQMFGGGVSEGIFTFADWFAKVNDAANNFGDFGMSNEQMSKAYADYITVARTTGFVNRRSIDAQSKLGDGFRELMLETGALASLTGKGRDELLQARAAALSEPKIAAALRRIRDNYGEDAKFAVAAESILTQLQQFAPELGSVGTALTEAIGIQLQSNADRIDNFNIDSSLGQMDSNARGILQALNQTTSGVLFEQIDEAVKTGAVQAGDINKFILEAVRVAGDNTVILAQVGGEIVNPLQEGMLAVRNASTLLERDAGAYLDMTEEETRAAYEQYRRDLPEAGKTTVGFNSAAMAVMGVQDALLPPLDSLGDAAEGLGKTMLSAVEGLENLFSPSTESRPITQQENTLLEMMDRSDLNMSDPMVRAENPEVWSEMFRLRALINSIQPFNQQTFDNNVIPGMPAINLPVGNTSVRVYDLGFGFGGPYMYAEDQTPISLPGRYSGGGVSANMPYVVGENRPGGLGELFVPDSSGFIMSHDKTSAMIQDRINSVLGLVSAFNSLKLAMPNTGTFAGTTPDNITSNIIPITSTSIINNKPRQVNTLPIEEPNVTGNNIASINDQIKQINDIKRRYLETMRSLEDMMKRYTRKSDPLRA
jgi:hypothetical protein